MRIGIAPSRETVGLISNLRAYCVEALLSAFKLISNARMIAYLDFNYAVDRPGNLSLLLASFDATV